MPCTLNSQKRYAIPTNKEAIKIVVARAYTQIGVSKQDPIVLEYLRTCNIYTYANWCAAGLVWCFENGYNDYNKLFDFEYNIPIKKTAVANEHYNYIAQVGKETTYKADIGDLLVWRQINSWQGHIEIVIEVGKLGWVTTIGFNTSDNNTRQGGFVDIKKRNLHNPIGKLQVRGLIGFLAL